MRNIEKVITLTNKETVSKLLSWHKQSCVTDSVMLQLPKHLPSVKLIKTIAPFSKPTRAFWLQSNVCHHTMLVGLASGI